MNNETILLLEKYFDVAFAAPDGVKKLRELILSLAMQGKLVPQDPSDQSARELLKEIEAEKSRLVKDGKIKASKPLPEIKPDEVPYDLPKAWEWVRLGDIIFDAKTGIDKGKEFQSESNDYPYFKMNNISNFGYCDFSNVNRINYDGDDYKKYVLRDGDFLFNTRNSKELVGKTCIFQSPNNELWFFNNNILRIEFSYSIEKYFANFWFLSRLGKIELEKLKSATTNVAAIYQGRLVLFPIPIPPLAEQRRIVAKIDELMARCDDLEKLRQVHAQKQITVHTAALNQLLTGKDHNDFKNSWHFITQHFDELYSVKANVTELRKAILQLAVMGKLVPQDPNDQPASELLNAIEAEKNRLVKVGKIKPSKPLPKIETDEFFYDLPKGWEFVRLGQLANEITTGPFGLMIHKSDYITNGVPLINPIHMVNGEIIHDPTVTVTNEKARQLDSHRLFEGDIVMARRGELGRCAIVSKLSDQWLCGTGSFVLRLPSQISRSFILTLFKSKGVRDYLGGNSVGTTMTNLNHGILNKLPIMLPPLAEQHRIVAKIDQLMTLCDELEKQIDIADHKKTNLLNSVMTKV
jgi:type I restriction enzyme S subunit